MEILDFKTSDRPRGLEITFTIKDSQDIELFADIMAHVITNFFCYETSAYEVLEYFGDLLDKIPLDENIVYTFLFSISSIGGDFVYTVKIVRAYEIKKEREIREFKIVKK